MQTIKFNKLHLTIHQIFTLKSINLQKEFDAKLYSFLVIDATIHQIILYILGCVFQKELKNLS